MIRHTLNMTRAMIALVLVILAISEPSKAEPPVTPQELANAEGLIDTLALARVMHCEASNQGRAGMLAVADVVLNRVASPRYPDSIPAVTHQRWQFTCVTLDRRESLEHPTMREAIDLAREVLAGNTPRMTRATHYYNPRFVAETPYWAEKFAYLGRIGDHEFYLEN